MQKPAFNLFGDIVQDDASRFFMCDTSPQMIIDWLNQQTGDIEININSLGGSVTGGIAIANAIKLYHNGIVTANVMGVAASISSVIACAADELKMGEGSFLMVHNPWTFSIGDAEALRKDAETLDKMKAAIIGFYQSKFTCPADKLAEYMDAETWIASSKCEAYCLAASPMESEFRAAACASHFSFDKAPEAAHRFFNTFAPISCGAAQPADAHISSGAAQPADAPLVGASVWQARLSGLQAAKDKEIAALKSQLDDQAKMHGDAVAEFSAKIESLSADIAEKETALATSRAEAEEAKASLATSRADAEQLRQKLSDAEKALADSQAALAAETQRYRDQIGAALQPPKSELSNLHGRELAVAALKNR